MLKFFRSGHPQPCTAVGAGDSWTHKEDLMLEKSREQQRLGKTKKKEEEEETSE